ncbi:hypothetical protein [Polaribacter sp. L3A8]|uniref:hypothetical protein n=1 Tax=Polaribacter sp. L3A8 TaxID=2686361 RepID=UPI00131CF653
MKSKTTYKWLKRRLTAYKVPKFYQLVIWRFIIDLPKKQHAYRPIAKVCGITQIESNIGLGMMHQGKLCIRTTYSWMSELILTSFVLEKNAFKANIFNSLIVKTMEADKILQPKFISN